MLNCFVILVLCCFANLKMGPKRNYSIFEKTTAVEPAKKRKPNEPMKILSWNVAGLNACVVGLYKNLSIHCSQKDSSTLIQKLKRIHIGLILCIEFKNRIFTNVKMLFLNMLNMIL